MKVLFVSNLFPDESEPQRGIYNARLLRSLSKKCEIRVVSPRPSLPFRGGATHRPRTEDAALQPLFPTVRYIPKIGSAFNHRLMARSLRAHLRQVQASFQFDVILASWLYPDACGVSILARELDVPLVAVCQGSDAHQYLNHPTRKRIIVESLEASTIITRSLELARLLQGAGIEKQRLKTIYNGVDLDLFHPIDKGAARQALNLPLHDKIVLFVGNFYPVKNPHLVARAYIKLCTDNPDNRHRLIMIGDGPERKGVIQSLVGTGFEPNARFPGRLSTETVARYMQAADVLCVPSDNEGVPNVILEAFATGLKVTATEVGGIPEVLNAPHLGALTRKGDPDQLSTALRNELNKTGAREQIREHANQFSWEKAADAYLDTLQDVAGNRA